MRTLRDAGSTRAHVLECTQRHRTSVPVRVVLRSCAARCIGATVGRNPRTTLRAARHPGDRESASTETQEGDLLHHQRDSCRSAGYVNHPSASDLYPSMNEEERDQVRCRGCLAGHDHVAKHFRGLKKKRPSTVCGEGRGRRSRE